LTTKIYANAELIERAHKLTVETCHAGILFEKAGVKAKCNLIVTKE